MRLTLIPPNERTHFEWLPYLYGDEFDIKGVEVVLYKYLSVRSMGKEDFITFLFQFCLDVASKFNTKLGYEEDTLQMGAVVIHAALLERSMREK